MKILWDIAWHYLWARKRQSVVSLLGIVLGVGFFLAIAGLMRGSEQDFVRRLVDNSPHVTMYDEYRQAKPQPVNQRYPAGTLIELRSLKPQYEVRGIRGYQQILQQLRREAGVRAAGVLSGQALVSFAGRDVAIQLSGMVPEDVRNVTTIENYMRQGSVEDLMANRNGIIVGKELLRKLSLQYGDNLTVSAPNGQVRTFQIIGVFRTGQVQYDASQAFIDLKRQQALMNRPNRINSLIIKLPEPTSAHAVARQLERQFGYKTVSWQEASEDLLSTLAIRNMIMYSVVSAVLVVAAFGIYNVISTVAMEKHRDIAILKSMGFTAKDVRRIFLWQGTALGILGCASGIPLGLAMMWGLTRLTIQPPGLDEPVNLPMDWSYPAFVIAAVFALTSAMVAAWLPARKASSVLPVDILRGGSG